MDAGVSSLPDLSRGIDKKTKINLPENVQRYCEDKKTSYLQQSVLPESDWPPSLGGKYIRLALIKQGRSMYDLRYEFVIEQQIDYTRGDYDKIMERKTKTDLTNAFKNTFCEAHTELELRMLIDGAPGVGKTTLSRRVSCMWAKNELLERYWLVLLLHLRERAVSKAKTIDEFFYHDDPNLQQCVIKYVKEVSGHGVLIIFDGFDELSSYERSEESLFLDICKGKILHKCAVVITSRPYASRSIQELRSINRHVEVLGFTEEQVKVCIKEKIEDEDKAKELCEELKDRLDIASICQIPLNCSIVLYVYQQENYCLPRTLTELYEFFILHSLKRFIKRTQSISAANRLQSLKKLPSPSKEHFILLCKLAFNGLMQDKLVFSRDDVEEIFPSKYQESDLDLPLLDLMTSAKSYSSTGAQDTYSFLHLTIQEFLGAYWIAHYSLDTNKLLFFQKTLMNNRFRMVLMFLSGMTKLALPNIASVFSKESWERDKVHICLLTYEAGSHSLCKYISENYCNSPRSIELTGSRFDKLVVSSFLAYSNCRWDEVKLIPDDIKILHKAFSSVSLHCPTFIAKVILHFNSINRHVDLSLLAFLDKIPQIDRISVYIEFSGGMREESRVYDEILLTSLSKGFIGPQAVKNKSYSIMLAEPSNYLEDHYNRVITQFCEILAKSFLQNSSVTELTLHSVFPQDIKCIFASLGEINSISGLERLVCKCINRTQPSLFERGANSKEFCDTLTAFVSNNKSLKEVFLDINLDDKVVCSYVETITSGLSHNATLQKLTLCPYKVYFERNQETRLMELKYVPKLEQKQLYLSGMSSLYESGSDVESNAPDMSSPLPPAKRPCMESFLLQRDIGRPHSTVDMVLPQTRAITEMLPSSQSLSQKVKHSHYNPAGPSHEPDLSSFSTSVGQDFLQDVMNSNLTPVDSPPARERYGMNIHPLAQPTPDVIQLVQDLPPLQSDNFVVHSKSTVLPSSMTTVATQILQPLLPSSNRQHQQDPLSLQTTGDSQFQPVGYRQQQGELTSTNPSVAQRCGDPPSMRLEQPCQIGIHTHTMTHPRHLTGIITHSTSPQQPHALSCVQSIDCSPTGSHGGSVVSSQRHSSHAMPHYQYSIPDSSSMQPSQLMYPNVSNSFMQISQSVQNIQQGSSAMLSYIPIQNEWQQQITQALIGMLTNYMGHSQQLPGQFQPGMQPSYQQQVNTHQSQSGSSTCTSTSVPTTTNVPSTSAHGHL